jgi:hypothetical protein
MLSAVMLSAVMLSAVILSVVMLSVVLWHFVSSDAERRVLFSCFSSSSATKQKSFLPPTPGHAPSSGCESR